MTRPGSARLTGKHPLTSGLQQACVAEDVDEPELRASAERIAEAAAARLRDVHPELTVTTRVEDCPAELTFVDASADAGLVVVGTRGRGAFQGMLLGSVSHAVIHGAECAVAVVAEGQGERKPDASPWS